MDVQHLGLATGNEVERKGKHIRRSEQRERGQLGLCGLDSKFLICRGTQRNLTGIPRFLPQNPISGFWKMPWRDKESREKAVENSGMLSHRAQACRESGGMNCSESGLKQEWAELPMGWDFPAFLFSLSLKQIPKSRILGEP